MRSPTSLIRPDSSSNMTSSSAEQNLDVGGGGGVDCIPLTFCDVASIYADGDIHSWNVDFAVISVCFTDIVWRNRAMSSFRALRTSFPASACFLAYHTEIIAKMTPSTPIGIEEANAATSPDARPPDDVLELDGVAVIPFPVKEV